MTEELIVIGGGLAGAEAAWQAAHRGIKVKLYEMRPEKMTPAHKTGKLAELVCSNSLKADAIDSAAGLLKEEMRRLNSLIIGCADEHRIPAGGALAVDREGFAEAITAKLAAHPLVEIINEEVSKIPEESIVCIATGPLTSDALAEEIRNFIGEDYLYFFDAAAPIVTRESIDFDKAFIASRYDKGEAAYINCPMNKKEYDLFWDNLVAAELAPIKDFEKEVFFEGCMPVEQMARRGRETLLFGPLKPVGLIDPRTGELPHAVVQLRQDNREGTLFNLVGFQTHLKWGEQKRVFGMIPALRDAEFVRYGVMHRNTFIDSPKTLLPTMQSRKDSRVFFAGQLTGVEGYVESAMSGLVAGINAARYMNNQEMLVFPVETAIGGLCNYVTDPEIKKFQPMNMNFGLFPSLGRKIRNKREKYGLYAERALNALEEFKKVSF